MCNFINSVEARGIEKGIEKGKIQSLQSLMKNMKLTVQQAMELLEIPDCERNRYEKLLEIGD